MGMEGVVVGVGVRVRVGVVGVRRRGEGMRRGMVGGRGRMVRGGENM